ncbi:MAG: guanylate kinase [Bacteroidota bacterium]
MVQVHSKIFIISAPSGAGKTTLVKAMMERFDCFAFSISATTRGPRSYEQDGVHYHFLELEDFKQRRENGEFLEWEEVYPGKFYGTLRTEVDNILAQGKCPIFDVDVVGGVNIKQEYGSRAVSIFIQPPHAEVLLERLKSRASEDSTAIHERYSKAKKELAFASKFDHVIVNDVLEVAIDEMQTLIQSYLRTP